MNLRSVENPYLWGRAMWSFRRGQGTSIHAMESEAGGKAEGLDIEYWGHALEKLLRQGWAAEHGKLHFICVEVYGTELVQVTGA